MTGSRRCALPGCYVVIEPPADGQPQRKYCTAAHRAIARQQRREGTQRSATAPPLMLSEPVSPPRLRRELPLPPLAVQLEANPARHRQLAVHGRRTRTVAVLGSAGLLVTGGTLTLADDPRSTEAASAAPWQAQGPEADQHWASEARVSLSSVERQLEDVAAAERDWNSLPAEERAGQTPDGVRDLARRKALLEQQRSSLADRLASYENLNQAKQNLVHNEQAVAELDRTLSAAPAPRQSSAADADNTRRLREQRAARARELAEQRQKVDALREGMREAMAGPLPSGDHATRSITSAVRELVRDPARRHPAKARQKAVTPDVGPAPDVLDQVRQAPDGILAAPAAPPTPPAPPASAPAGTPKPNVLAAPPVIGGLLDQVGRGPSNSGPAGGGGPARAGQPGGLGHPGGLGQPGGPGHPGGPGQPAARPPAHHGPLGGVTQAVPDVGARGDGLGVDRILRGRPDDQVGTPAGGRASRRESSVSGRTVTPAVDRTLDHLDVPVDTGRGRAADTGGGVDSVPRDALDSVPHGGGSTRQKSAGEALPLPDLGRSNRSRGTATPYGGYDDLNGARSRLAYQAAESAISGLPLNEGVKNLARSAVDNELRTQQRRTRADGRGGYTPSGSALANRYSSSMGATESADRLAESWRSVQRSSSRAASKDRASKERASKERASRDARAAATTARALASVSESVSASAKKLRRASEAKSRSASQDQITRLVSSYTKQKKAASGRADRYKSSKKLASAVRDKYRSSAKKASRSAAKASRSAAKKFASSLFRH